MAEDQMKWIYGASGLGFAAFAVYQFLSEAKKSMRSSNRPRQPWDGL